MRCNECGCEFDEGMFCPECGTKFVSEETTKDVVDDSTSRELSLQEKELETSRMKLEQAKLEKERLEIEENNRKIQAENQKLREEENKKQAEIQSRSYKGVTYNSVEEMMIAKADDEKEIQNKRVDKQAVWCLVLSLAPFTVIGAYFFWATGVLALILGILALKGKTRKKGLAITGIVIDSLLLLVMIGVVIYCVICYA